MVSIVGIGPGSREYILPKAIDTILRSDLIIGFERALRSVEFTKVQFKAVKNIEAIVYEINANKDKAIAVVASGDPCFYGITNYIKENYKANIEVIPGISSFQYMACKLGMPWQGSFLSSIHGRYGAFMAKVRENHISIWLTDSKHSGEFICKELFHNNIDATVYIGENLSYEDEKITIGCPKELAQGKFSGFSVVIIENMELK